LSLPKALRREKLFCSPQPHRETGIRFVPYLQRIRVLAELIALKDDKNRGHRGAEHSFGPEVKSLALTRDFRHFPRADRPRRLVSQAIDGWVPQVNPISMVSDA
jgi:hypothetical protein